MNKYFRTVLIVASIAFAIAGVGPNSGAYAQEETAPIDYIAWEKVAIQAEIALDLQRASTAALENLRKTLATWRARFLSEQGTGVARIETLKSQITALGDPPAEGEIESDVLTERRAQLAMELANLNASRLGAQEAHSRAEGLIRETDVIIRSRNAALLYENQGSPFLVNRWPNAMSEFSSTLRRTGAEIKVSVETNRDRFLYLQDFPRTVFFTVLAFVLLLRGRGWMVKLTAYVQGDMQGARAGIRGMLVSLGQLALPVFGIFALVSAFSASGLLGFRGQIIDEAFYPIGISFFVARWLALRLFPIVRKRPGFIHVSDTDAVKVRRYAGILALFWGLNRLLIKLSNFEGYAAETFGVLQFPLVLFGGLTLIWFGQTFRTSVVNRDPVTAAGGMPAEHRSFRERSVFVFGIGLILLGLAGPVLAALGFAQAGATAVFSSILMLGLLAFVIILSGFFRDVYALLTGKDDEAARQSLVPVLVSFSLALASIPALALIWGARSSDLTEMWERFKTGVSLGDATISPGAFLAFALIFAIGYMATRLLQSTLRSSVLPKTRIDPGAQSAIVSGLGYVGYFIAALVAISTAGIDLSSLAIVIGALSVGIGIGLQNIVSNFVSGIILLIERPISEGDWIAAGGYEGTVREIAVRSTRIETFDRSDVIIPNSDLVSGSVTNYTRGNSVGRAVVSVGVAYGSDTRHVQEVLARAAVVHRMVISDPAPGIHLVNFGADSIDFQIRAVLRDVNYVLTVKSEIMHEIARLFREEGIEIPFAQRDVWLRNPESIAPPKAASPKPAAKPKPKPNPK